MSSICFVCEKPVIKPYGYSQSKILIVGDAPTKDDLKQMRPFSIPKKRYGWSDGKILRQEMANAGLDLFQCRIQNLWYHAPSKKEGCFEASKNVVLDEAKGKQAILLIGADPVEYFTGYKVGDVNGLQVESNMLSAPIIYAMIHPGKMRNLGELKFGIESFVHHVKKEGII